jgi:hypothetical protein
MTGRVDWSKGVERRWGGTTRIFELSGEKSFFGTSR